MNTHIKYILIGIIILLIIKYGVIGLIAWNNIFHPDRKESSNLLSTFGKPFLGILSN